MSAAGNGKTIAFDVENISMTIDWFEKSDISFFDGASSIEIKSCFS
jgi:hypothetical protein